MTVSAVLSRRARRELASAVSWIAKDNPDVAAAFNDAVRVAARRVGGNPFLGRNAPPPFLPVYRFWSLPRFGYLLIYDPAKEPVEILRCVHATRDLPDAPGELRGPPAA